ncbi:MAG: cation-translocating P-type ATPase [Phycisphaerales bacterium]|nr:cation-translocating P-type ATPase [Phycisphaerales bacterium]
MASATHSHDHAGHDHNHDHADHDHAPAASSVQCCSHHEMEIDRWIIFYLVGGVLVLSTPVIRWFGWEAQIAEIPAAIGALILAIPLFWVALKEVRTLRISSSSLAALGILGALAIGNYVGAGMLALILLVADQILRRTAFGAQRAIEALVNLTPDVARILDKDGTEQDVALGQVTVGQTVRVRAGENLPVDGVVTVGRTTINQASLTGEAAPVEVQPGDLVYAGTSNLTGQIDLRVTQVGEQTTIGKVSQLIREAEQSKSPRQLLIEQVSKFFVPVALSIAAVTWFIKSQGGTPAAHQEAAEAAISVLVVCCPAALLLSSPSAMVAAFAAAARLGIMIKRVEYLEASSNLDAVVMDKTGTITTGKFEVARLAPATGVEGADLLRAAAIAEQHSNHPLAQSILRTARAARVELGTSGDVEEIHGRGVRAKTPEGELLVGRASWLRELDSSIADEMKIVEGRIEGMSGVHVMRGGKYLGAVGLEDKVKPGTKKVIERMRELGVRTVAIFTGDRLSVAKRVGMAVGVDTIEAECLPEEKHQQIERMVGAGYRTMMVGDGINDGPSLAAADVGVAMGLSGSDIATNSAGIALMTDELNRIPFLIELARRTRTIVAQNIAASIVIVIVGLVLASTGLLGIGLAGLYHFVGDVFVLANSFRLFRFGEDFGVTEDQQAQVWQRREGSIRLGGVAQPA